MRRITDKDGGKTNSDIRIEELAKAAKERQAAENDTAEKNEANSIRESAVSRIKSEAAKRTSAIAEQNKATSNTDTTAVVNSTNTDDADRVARNRAMIASYAPTGKKAETDKTVKSASELAVDKLLAGNTTEGTGDETSDTFSYDAEGDAMYQQYKDTYLNNANLAMQNAMGQAAAMTGGYGNSYAQTVGQQQYAQTMQGLTDIIPELEATAYERWNNQKSQEANAYQTQLDQANSDRDYALSLAKAGLKVDETTGKIVKDSSTSTASTLSELNSSSKDFENYMDYNSLAADLNKLDLTEDEFYETLDAYGDYLYEKAIEYYQSKYKMDYNVAKANVELWIDDYVKKENLSYEEAKQKALEELNRKYLTK